jgi:energy-coupling factor transport system permease protein
VEIYLYVERDSWLHRRDPRAKFFALAAIVLLAVAGDQLWLPLSLLILGLVGIHTSGAWRSLWKVRTVLIAIVAVSTIIWALFATGDTPLWGPVQVESVLFGITTGMKLAAMIVAAITWLSTTRNEEIAAGFVRMGAPYRVAFAFSAALRMVPTFAGAGMTIAQAQRARGLDLEAGGPIARMRTYLPLLIPVFGTALRSVNHQAMALEARGFGAQRERTSLLELRMGIVDWFVLVVSVAGIALGLWVFVTDALAMPGLHR